VTPRQQKRKKRALSPGDWENLPDAEILQLRIRDLGLHVETSPLADCIGRMYNELAAHGFRFRPACYLADEWFCPNKIPVIGIPFCLAHPRLKSIEAKMMLEVEGGTDESCMRLLRHECGHAFNYAYRLYTRTRWRELFGAFSKRYSSAYFSQPYSRRYVVNLQNNYAQAHPDEDFAETFAVWLAPDSQWETKYHDWPVIRKLSYVERLARRIRDQAPPIVAHETPFSAARMTSTLAAHYERKRQYLGEEFPGYYDPSLRRVFAERADGNIPKASALLRRHRRRIVDSVHSWTGHRKYDVHQLVNKLVKRCDALDLGLSTAELDALIDVTSLVTAVANRSLSTDEGSKHI